MLGLNDGWLGIGFWLGIGLVLGLGFVGAVPHRLDHMFFMVGPCSMSDNRLQIKDAIAMPSAPPILVFESKLDNKSSTTDWTAVTFIMFDFTNCDI